MKRWMAGAAAVLVLSCAGGLYTAYGNAFPCDFAKGPGLRDKDCPTGWVCGTNNACKAFEDEGLPSDPVPTLPDFTAPVRVFPALLTGPVRHVGADPGVPGQLLAGDFDGGFYFVTPSSFATQAVLPPPNDSVPPVDDVLGTALNKEHVVLHVRTGNGEVLWRTRFGQATFEVITDLGSGSDAHVLTLRVGARTQVQLRDGGTETVYKTYAQRGPDRLPGYVNDGGATFQPFDIEYTDGGFALDAGSSLSFGDVRIVTRQRLDPLATGQLGWVGEAVAPLAVTSDGFYLLERTPYDGGEDPVVPTLWRQLNTDALGLTVPLTAHHSADGQVWAVHPAGSVLSTWKAQPSAQGIRLVRAWDDCTPCPAGTALLLTSPQSQPSPNVEVLCGSNSGGISLWRVVGSTATTPQGACDVQGFTAPFDAYELSTFDTSLPDGGQVFGTLVSAESQGDAVTLGGLHGQLWQGPSLSSLKPLFLDRVPLAAGSVGGTPFVIADSFFALQNDAGFAVTTLNQLSSGQIASTNNLAAAVKDADGWFLLNTGDIVSLDGGRVGFGPGLVTAAGAAQTGPFRAQANRTRDSLVIAANDSLYLYALSAANLGSLSSAAGQNGGLIPQLTPQPNSPIRSMVVDDTLSPALDGGQAINGYLLTSTTVFQFRLGGAPQQWTAQPILSGLGEPVRVWMQSPTNAHGRVAFRDGSVYTLPDGFPLVGPLPAPDGGVGRLLDSTTLGGYPVGLAADGLYVAEPPAGFAGGPALLQWQPIARNNPDLPTSFSRGLLQVLPEGAVSTLYLFSDWGHIFRIASAPNN